MPDISIDQLKSAELKVTGPRKVVLEILSVTKNPLDAEEIQEILHKKKFRVDQATVYRILKTFADKGIVRKVSLQEGKTHYELSDRPHHHHIICLTCGAIQDIEECGMEAMEREIEKKTGFSIQSHSFELFGICSSCKHTK